MATGEPEGRVFMAVIFILFTLILILILILLLLG